LFAQTPFANHVNIVNAGLGQTEAVEIKKKNPLMASDGFFTK
jgi:hypothetical protein